MQFSEEGQAAYSRLLDRPENSAGGGEVGPSIRWPSPLLATPDHRIVATEIARVLGTNGYDWAYIQKYGDQKLALQIKRQEKIAFEGWVHDYDARADRLAGLWPGSNPDDPAVGQALRDFYKGV